MRSNDSNSVVGYAGHLRGRVEAGRSFKLDVNMRLKRQLEKQILKEKAQYNTLNYSATTGAATFAPGGYTAAVGPTRKEK